MRTYEDMVPHVSIYTASVFTMNTLSPYVGKMRLACAVSVLIQCKRLQISHTRAYWELDKRGGPARRPPHHVLKFNNSRFQ